MTNALIFVTLAWTASTTPDVSYRVYASRQALDAVQCVQRPAPGVEAIMVTNTLSQSNWLASAALVALAPCCSVQIPEDQMPSPTGHWFFGVTAIGTNGLESDLSNVVEWSVVQATLTVELQYAHMLANGPTAWTTFTNYVLNLRQPSNTVWRAKLKAQQ